MKYIIKCMNEEYLKKIISWKYDDEYEVYNMESYDSLKRRNAAITDESKKENYLCFFKRNELIGYTNISKKKDDEIFLGIGLAPKYCGKGLGEEILRESIEVIKERYGNVKIYLKVRAWNKRAIACYKKVGFNITDEIAEKDHNNVQTNFVYMKYII